MYIKSLLGETLEVTDLKKAISQTTLFVEYSKGSNLKLGTDKKIVRVLDYYTYNLEQLKKLENDNRKQQDYS